MNEPAVPVIRPETRALKESCLARVAQGRKQYDGTRLRALLLIQPGCETTPPALLLDSQLQPVDKIVFLVVLAIALRTTGDAYMPPQAALAHMANVSSPDTVWRALSILRCARWLTVCHTKSCRGGRLEPAVYLVNAAPMPMADTLFLDRDYGAFLTKCGVHGHARVRKVARAILAQMSGEPGQGHREHPPLAIQKN